MSRFCNSPDSDSKLEGVPLDSPRGPSMREELAVLDSRTAWGAAEVTFI